MKLTYVGRRIVTGGKLLHCFINQEREPDMLTFFAKTKPSTFAGCVIGTTYEVDKVFPNSWREAKIDVVSEEATLRWQAMDRAEYLKHSQKNVDASPHLSKAIEAIRTARQGVSPNQRVAFDVWLLDQVR